ncbi:MAG TPA: VacB/RNase II family 3'-5' exoribonuclease [Planctomycetaceae bacterium]|nr:VacB/RNase II family 3'-5' exoribonuclease [Planctomycetaceae bacterium]
MNPLEDEILEYLAQPGQKPVDPRSLGKRLGLRKKQLPVFFDAVERLLAGGRIREGKKGRIRIAGAAELIAGIVKRVSSGAGYFIPHELMPGLPEGSVYIAGSDMHDAHTGDEVLVRMLKRRRSGGQRCGRIEEILVRATSMFVGTYVEEAGRGLVRVDGTAFRDPIFVGDPGAKGARTDDKVVIEMLRFPSHMREGEAVLTKVLGPRGEPGVDTQSIVHEFGLPHEFDEDVLEEARAQAEQFEEDNLRGRLDLTGETIITIDPVDARDFDDAISLTRSPDGHWHLGVHIADVAAFVLPRTPLDREAQRRGNSVYLPGTVIPMLPEILSNGLASLQAGKVRFTKSAFIEYTPEGVPVSTRFANSAIKVTRRFAYEEVLPILRDPEKFKSRVPAKVRQLLAWMHELAMLLRRRRFEAGALELTLGEVKLDFDADNRVTGAHEVQHDESHQIIEEFMLAANVAVATELWDRGVLFLRRVHGEPDLRKLKAFAEFVNALGYPLKQYQSRGHLQDLVRRVRGEPAEHAVNYALLRSMKQAMYSAVETGHYALSVEHYCHFTSPIRRYPDLAVHRMVDAVVLADRGANGGRVADVMAATESRASRSKASKPGRRGHRHDGSAVRGLNDMELEKLGKHCSGTERRAEAAERELTKVKLLTYLEDRIGDELDAIITGVERFGIFCRGIELPAEGLVPIAALDRDDYFYHDPASISLTGRRTGKQYRLGDRVRVSIAHVDVDRRELDFALVEGPAPRRPNARSPRSGPPRERRSRRR